MVGDLGVDFVEVVEPGDIILIEPNAFGGSSTKFTAQHICSNTEDTVAFIEDFAQNYPKNKPMTFGDVLFIPKAKEIDSEKIIKLTQSREELLQAAARKEEGIIARHGDELLLLQQQLEIASKKIDKLEDQAKKTEQWKESLKSELMQINANHNCDLECKEAEIRRLKALLDRPKLPKDVCDWVQRNYAGKMIFHSKAIALMNSVAPGRVDIPVLCDALEFLATEYRDGNIGLIDEAEMRRRCAEKYNRPFTVTPLAEAAIEAYPADYKIKYYMGFTGKPRESLLDLHLSIGNKSENLIRIYFLYDKEKQLIVVGSLPKHLPTLAYK